MSSLLETVRDAVRWFRGADLPPPAATDPDAEPVRIWLEEQEQASKASAQQIRERDWLERKLVYRTGVEE